MVASTAVEATFACEEMRAVHFHVASARTKHAASGRYFPPPARLPVRPGVRFPSVAISHRLGRSRDPIVAACCLPGIVSLRKDGQDIAAVAKMLLDEHSIVIAARRGFLRVSPHFYNEEEEIERLVAALP